MTETSLRRWVPDSLELDTWEGTPWIGVTPLHLRNLRLRGLPPVPGFAEVLEVDVRTYVHCQGVRGVFYLTMEASNPLVGAAARTAYHMPYRSGLVEKAAMRDGWSMQCRRESPLGLVDWQGDWRPVGAEYECSPETLEGHVIDQWELFTVDGRGQLYQSSIHRSPWTLRAAECHFGVDTIASVYGLELLQSSPHVCCSRGVDVLVWWPKPMS